MKTTIEIADDLICRAKLVQKREDVTLRALVEDGLRLVLDRHAHKAKYRFVPIVVGKPYKSGMPVSDVNELVAASNERAWTQREFGHGAVHESPADYRKPSKRAAARKRGG